MKTIFSPQQYKQPLANLCESTLSKSSSWVSLLLAPGLFSWVARKSKSFRLKIAHAFRDQAAGLAALLMTISTNGRIYSGLGLMGVVAPLSGCAYMIFNRTEHVEGWYHVNYFHLFYLLGPHLFEFFCLLGVFLLFPKDSKRSFILIVPTGYVLAKIVWLVHVSSNAELWSVVPSSIVLISMMISGTLFILMNWLTWRKFHGEDSFDKRLFGLEQIAEEIPDAKFKSMACTAIREKRNFQSKY